MRAHTFKYVNALFMLTLLVSPCYGGTTTFLEKETDGDMSVWGENCETISVETKDGMQQIPCDRDHDKCTGAYIEHKQDEEGWGNAECYMRPVGGVFNNEGVNTALEILGIASAVALVVAGGYGIYKSIKGRRTIARDKFNKELDSYGELELKQYGELELILRNKPVDAVTQTEVLYQELQRYKTNIGVQVEPALSDASSQSTIKVSNAKTQATMHKLDEAEWYDSLTAEAGTQTQSMSQSYQQMFSSRKLLQVAGNVSTLSDTANTRVSIVMHEHWSILDTEVHKKFFDTILEYTGTPPLDVQFPAPRRTRKMLENTTTGGMCGFVNVSMPETPGGKTTYANTACKTTVSENITSFLFPQKLMTLDKNNTWHIDPSWNILTALHPRLGHPADARQHKGVLSWIHPEEKQVVAYPYLSFGNFIPYIPSDAPSTMEHEGFLQMEKDLHAQKIAHPDHRAVSAGGGGGIFSRETMTTLHAVIERVETVITAANAGDYLSYSGEFPPSTIRDPQKVCAGIVASGAWKAYGFPGGNTTTPVKGKYCGAIRPQTGLPSTTLMMETGFHMYAGLSNVMDAAFEDFVSSGARSRADWYWLSRLSLTVMGWKIQALHYIWTFAAGMQPVPVYA